jgi:hypothetical protein
MGSAGSRARESVGRRDAAVDAASRLAGAGRHARIDAGPVRRQAPARRPVPQAFHRLALDRSGSSVLATIPRSEALAQFAEFAGFRSRPARDPRHAGASIAEPWPPPFLRILRILRTGPHSEGVTSLSISPPGRAIAGPTAARSGHATDPAVERCRRPDPGVTMGSGPESTRVGGSSGRGVVSRTPSVARPGTAASSRTAPSAPG